PGRRRAPDRSLRRGLLPPAGRGARALRAARGRRRLARPPRAARAARGRTVRGGGDALAAPPALVRADGRRPLPSLRREQRREPRRARALSSRPRAARRAGRAGPELGERLPDAVRAGRRVRGLRPARAIIIGWHVRPGASGRRESAPAL